MVIKYKAKYIKDGEVVIDDTSLIELGDSESEGNASSGGARSKSNNAWEQMIEQSEQRIKDVGKYDGSDHSESVDKKN